MSKPAFETDREKAPLMKALDEVGLQHGVRMVVVAVPLGEGPTHTLLIDHKDDTSMEDVACEFVRAGTLLMLGAGRLAARGDEE